MKKNKIKKTKKKMNNHSNHNSSFVNKTDNIVLTHKPTVILSKDFVAQISYLHRRFASIEWSGHIIFEEQGSILDPNNLKLKVLGIHPLDVGSTTFTSSEANKIPELITDLWDTYPNLGTNGIKLGYCHTHHSMKAFFSGTDMDELHTNVRNYPYYLSLIVNFACDPVAKIAIVGTRKKTSVDDCIYIKQSPTDENNYKFKLGDESLEKEIIVEFDCNIEYELNPGFESYVDKVKETLEKNKRQNYYNSYHDNYKGHYVNNNEVNNYSVNLNKNGNKPNLTGAMFIQHLMLRIFYGDTEGTEVKYQYNSNFVTFMQNFVKYWKTLNDIQKNTLLSQFENDDYFEKVLCNHINDFFDVPSYQNYVPDVNDVLDILINIKKWSITYENGVGDFIIEYRIRCIQKLLLHYENIKNEGKQTKINFTHTC